jgi:hypothetical protein
MKALMAKLRWNGWVVERMEPVSKFELHYFFHRHYFSVVIPAKAGIALALAFPRTAKAQSDSRVTSHSAVKNRGNDELFFTENMHH